MDVLTQVGGFEITGIAGFILGSAAARTPVVIDGVISGAVIEMNLLEGGAKIYSEMATSEKAGVSKKNNDGT
jgi:NaMN:DMB phosphoribosyltransferase